MDEKIAILKTKQGWVNLEGIDFKSEEDLDRQLSNTKEKLMHSVSCLYALATCTPGDLFPPDKHGDTYTKMQDAFMNHVKDMSLHVENLTKMELAKDILVQQKGVEFNKIKL